MAYSLLRRRAVARSLLTIIALGLGLATPAAYAADTNSTPPAVTLTINPDGSAMWNGVPLAGVPDLKDKLARRTLQDPKLELDLDFHSVAALNDSNRQTLEEILELAARFGYVHLESTGTGARLTVLGPKAVQTAPK